MRINLPLLAFLASTVAYQQAPDKPQVGSIRGQVLDPTGSPIRGAKVFDEPMEAVRIGKDHFVISGDDGGFLLNDVPVGKTMVIATKVEDGYPDARFAVFSGSAILPVVEVKPGQIASDVVVKLQAKGATLTGKVLDSRTKLAIPEARITLSRLDHPTWDIETNVSKDGGFELVVPAMPMHFSIKSTGHENWNYEQSDLSPKHTPLTLSPGSKLEVLVYLEPSSPRH